MFPQWIRSQAIAAGIKKQPTEATPIQGLKEVKFVQPSATTKLWRAFAQATGEKLYGLTEFAYKHLNKLTPYFE